MLGVLQACWSGLSIHPSDHPLVCLFPSPKEAEGCPARAKGQPARAEGQPTTPEGKPVMPVDEPARFEGQPTRFKHQPVRSEGQGRPTLIFLAKDRDWFDITPSRQNSGAVRE